MSAAVVYSANGDILNADGNIDIIEMVAADDKPVAWCRFILSQKSELGDAQEENLRITVKRLQTPTSGSGGTTVASGKPDSGGAAGAATCESFNDTVATDAGTTETLLDTNWNVRAPFEFVWPDERFRPTAKGVEMLVLRCESTAGDDITGVSLTVEVLEG